MPTFVVVGMPPDDDDDDDAALQFAASAFSLTVVQQCTAEHEHSQSAAVRFCVCDADGERSGERSGDGSADGCGCEDTPASGDAAGSPATDDDGDTETCGLRDADALADAGGFPSAISSCRSKRMSLDLTLFW
jgi:hypothetical protein